MANKENTILGDFFCFLYKSSLKSSSFSVIKFKKLIQFLNKGYMTNLEINDLSNFLTFSQTFLKYSRFSLLI